MAGVTGRGDSAGRRELVAVLLAGAAGAGVVLLATRQELARVVVLAPRPLPASVTVVTGQDLRPAIAALSVAALASLAAVLATRGVLRRITGVLAMALGAGIALLAAGSVTSAAALAAAKSAGASLATGAGAGTAAGSVTAGGSGTGGSGDGLSLSGLPVHVMTGGAGWRALMIIGAVLVIAAGLAVLLRSGKMPVMSARYERPERVRGRGPRPTPARAGTGSVMWESLSAGEDPTDS
jgi:uncharacterized membrane protein (TIGR02234 family)